MIRCDHCLENLSSYLDQVLPENEMNDIEKHLKNCSSCAEEYEILKTIVSTCSELEEELPDDFTSSLHTRLEKARDDMVAERNRTGKLKLFSQIAAGFIIVITLGFAIRFGFFGNGQKLDNNAASDAAPLAAAGRKSFSVNIDAGSSVTAEEPEGGSEESFASQSIQEKADIAGEQSGENVKMFFAEKICDGESYDTRVTIVVDDIGKAIESIMAIDEKLGESSDNNMTYLNDYKACRGSSTRNGSVELKLVFNGESVMQSFLEEIKAAFPEVQVESVPSDEGQESKKEQEDEQEYIRIIIEKKK